ncbi:MAG: SRPBCC family protein [Actinomycetota bacterium]
MAEHRVTFEVTASPHDVFAFVSDLANLPDWDSSVRSATAAADTGPALGRSFDVLVGFYGRELETVCEIDRFDADTLVGWTITGKANGSVRVTLRPTESGTEVDHHLRVNLTGLARLLDRGLGVALEGIGENVERGLTRRFSS